MRRLFQAALGALAAAGSILGIKSAASAQPAAQSQTVPAPPASAQLPSAPVVRRSLKGNPKADALIAYTRHLRWRPIPIWIGRPRSAYGNPYRQGRP